MTFQELVEQYSDTDTDTLDFIEAVLRWRRNVQKSQVADVPRIWSGLNTLLKREGEVSTVDKAQEALGKDRTRLRRSKEAANAAVAKLQQEVNELQEEIEKSKQEKIELEKQKQESKT
ncbi:hypothetical protein FACS1894189_7100 [Planctomycetales bacterium]|nr:hypothetical protein FACS1894189_7100 [Planctomycetales bacterium]